MASDSPRAFNFSAGPSTLPDDVLMQARADIWSLFGTGIGILEHSHRGKAFDRVLHETYAALRAVSGLSDDYEIVMMAGGATVQFALLPQNFLRTGQRAGFVDSSIWTRVAFEQSVKQAPSEYIWSGKATNYDRIPQAGDLPDCSRFAYILYCTNNTVEGTQFPAPLHVNAPTICDTSSDIFSRRFDYSKHAVILACAQKNLGPSGNTVMFIRRDWLEAARDDVAPILSFRENAKHESRLNTPNTFGIYLIGQVCKWLTAQGGVAAMEVRNAEKANTLYDAIDNSGGFYRGTAQAWCRSAMNVTFRIANEKLEAKFISEATDQGLDGLAGHRTVGGMRASIYNAVPKAAIDALIAFMREFQRKNG